jgi:uncharacterized SAM-binding protein YcdF (DUF218 family)
MTQAVSNRSVAKDLAILVGFFGGLCAVLWGISGRSAVEKVLTHLAMPVGTIWLALFAITVLAFRRKQKAIGFSLVVVWFWLTIAGNGMVSGVLLARLEADYISTVATQLEPFDVIIVMGGGSSLGANGEPQTNSSGGRIVTAAHMYQKGLVKRIICGGGRIKSLTRATMDASEKTAYLLKALGVPSEALQFASGENSSEEIQDIARQLEPNVGRLGLITSAWHLPRAVRLANKHGLNVIPIPADFRSPMQFNEPPRFAEVVDGLIPKSGGLELSSIAIKEYLAHLVRR